MDFKIGDEIEEEGQQTSNLKVKSRLPLIIVIVLAIICGFLVFFLSNSLFGPKKPKEPTITRQKLTLKETNVEILYNYVTYGTKNQRGEKFIKESKVTLDSFTEEEKYYYALQFVDPDDLDFTGKMTDKNLKIYKISENKIRNYMIRFFGNKVNYSKEETIKYPFNFIINGQNLGTITYSNDEKAYTIVFDGYEADIEEKTGIKPYYAELSEAYKELDGTYTLEEKIIYTDLIKNEDNTYTLSIYKDYDHKLLIERKSNLTEEDIKDYEIKISDYKTKASTITYKFGLNGNTLYFESSSIKN